MAIIEPSNKDVVHPEQIKQYSSSLRLWHWANLIVISGSLLTVLLNSTLLKSRNVAPFIQSELKNAGNQATAEQTNSVAHALSDKVWDIHVYFGYGLAALLLFRIILEFFQLADQKFIRKIKAAYNEFKHVKKQREAARHELAVKLIYGVFYILLVIMVTTGLFLAFEGFFAPYKAIRHSVKSVHGFCMYIVLAFIAVHVIGVFLAERKDGKGVVSDMINGGGQNV
ncbi:MAG: cytochrome b/b6 domain-containing protein [Mucilaginibacter sp.]